MSESKEQQEEFSDFSEDESEDSRSRASDKGESDLSDDDSDFDASFAESEAAPRGGIGPSSASGKKLSVREVENQPYDAKVDLEDSFSDESVDTNDGDLDAAPPKMRALDKKSAQSPGSGGDSPPRGGSRSPGGGNLSEGEEIPGSLGSESKQVDEPASQGRQQRTEDSDSNSEDSEDDDDDSEVLPEKKITAGVKLEAQDQAMQDAARRAAEASARNAAKSGKKKKKRDERASESEEESEDDDDESSAGDTSDASGTRKASTLVGGYDPSDYQHLDVSSEVKELFQYIGRYKPHELELDSKLKCFVPDFIPAVGQIDTFVKIPPPNMEPDQLGLRVLDEPSANQSDATVLDLQLRAISKKTVRNPMIVRSIENASNDKKAVQGWIDSIKDLHRSKPMPTVHYTRQMPDIDSLMQVWPEEVEALMREIQLPNADIDLDLKDYARVVCATMDIPVFTSMVESLHVLFTLYTEFKTNQHFQRSSGINNSNNHDEMEFA